MNRTTRTTLRMILPLTAISIGTVFAQDYDIDWYTIDGGGAMWSTGDGLELGGTIGQPEAGVMTGTDYQGTFALTGGFWAAPPCWCLADLNNDGLRNGADIQRFIDCVMNGGPDCLCADVETDGLLDMADVATFVNDLLIGAGCQD